MSEPFLAEVRIFAGNFAPRNWAFCNGQLLPIAQNTALFSLIGTTYGGDGRTTTQLPDLQGRLPMHPGRGPGLTPRRLGEKVGVETVTLTTAQMASHNHSVVATGFPAENNDPVVADGLARAADNNQAYAPIPSPPLAMASSSLSSAGGNTAHNNMQPFLALNFIIALVGLYPSRG